MLLRALNVIVKRRENKACAFRKSAKLVRRFHRMFLLHGKV